MRIGIFFNCRPDQGGLYQYGLTMIDSLSKSNSNHQFFCFNATLNPLPIAVNKPNWKVITLSHIGIRWRLLLEFFIMLMAKFGVKYPLKIIPEYKSIKNSFIDLMIFTKPTIYSFQWKYKIIFPIHDLQHKIQPEFPEVSKNGEFNRREFIYNNSIIKASAIISDSITGKEDIINFYKTDPEIIFPLPYIVPSFRNISIDSTREEIFKKKFSLPEDFFFYPAAFWEHKNHINLIHAINHIFLTRKVKIPLVFTGSKKNNYFKIINLINDLNFSDTIYILGYVDEEEIQYLYSISYCLIMPTFFGPTNIPVLEAWSMNCPVITSDLRGIREQVGNAALLVNPKDIISIADGIWKLYSDKNLRNQLIEAGKIKHNSWKLEHFSERFIQIINTFE